MRMLKRYLHIFFALMAATALISCGDELVQPEVFAEDGIAAGEEILFTSFVPQSSLTRSAKEDFQNNIKGNYSKVNRLYAFTVKMFKKNPTDVNPTEIGSATYRPKLTADGTDFVEDGSLLETFGSDGMYWPDNVNHYGFEVTAGNSGTLKDDQKTEAKFVTEDWLKGYSYEPLWDGDEDTGNAKDNINAINYRTSNGWYHANKQVFADYGQMPIGSEEYKKVPLFIQHQRALVTVILKAGEGVSRDQLKHATSEENIHTKIISYGGGVRTEIDPLPEETTINYIASDFGGEKAGVENMTYHAIVEPYNYLTHPDEQPICTINLSNQKFSFYAANDKNYNAYLTDVAEHGVAMSDVAKNMEAAYNLQPGKHLIITATLSRESRKILITAYVEDWTDKVTTTICDDYGKNGDPILIRTREELYDFLGNTQKNKAGNVAIISPTSLDLEKTITKDEDDNITSSVAAPWPADKPLNCMLNLAGAVLYTEHPLFTSMSPSANLVNGTIVVRSGKTLSAVVTDRNEGTIERVSVRSERNAITGEPLPTAKVTSGGLVKDNYGTIFQCSSSIPVYGSGGYVGGIAAQSLQMENSSKSPVISECTVSASVDGSSDVTAGGGIVGNAVGRVSENTFEYGITVLQDAKFHNIIGSHASNTTDDLTAINNSWPTKYLEEISGINVNENAIYSGVIDSQAGLYAVVMNTEKGYNTNDSKILIADDFVVGNDWNVGRQDPTLNVTNNGNVQFELFGNDKTITLQKKSTQVTVDGTAYYTAPMLFTNIQNSIHDLTIVLEESLIASPSTTKDSDGNTTYDGIDAIAPLGYSVHGSTTVLSNIKVKTANDKYIQAAMAGGLVVWAYGDVTIDNCQFNGHIKVWLPTTIGSDAVRLAGGIAAEAEKASFNKCLFHPTSSSFVVNDEEHHTSVFFGGILGGVGPRDNSSRIKPSVTLKDCGSNLSQTSGKVGALIGRGLYDTNSTGAVQQASGIDSEHCEGNWWDAAAKAVGLPFNGMTDVKTVGQRNTLRPAFNSF